jgi:hypothetical protein
MSPPSRGAATAPSTGGAISTKKVPCMFFLHCRLNLTRAYIMQSAMQSDASCTPGKAPEPCEGMRAREAAGSKTMRAKRFETNPNGSKRTAMDRNGVERREQLRPGFSGPGRYWMNRSKNRSGARRHRSGSPDLSACTDPCTDRAAGSSAPCPWYCAAGRRRRRPAWAA